MRQKSIGRTLAPKREKRPAARGSGGRGAGSKAQTDATATLGELRTMMRHFVREQAWEKFHTPRNLAASVAVEAGELLELFQWLTPEEAAMRCQTVGGDPRFRKAVGEEISDVLMYLLSLANAVDLDVASTVAAKMEKNRSKYPAHRFQGWYERPLKATE